MKHFLMGVVSGGVIALAACNSNETSGSIESKPGSTEDSSATTAKSLEPKGPKPDWAPGIDDEMLVVIEKLGSYHAPAIDSLSAVEARKQPTPATAVMDVIQENSITVPTPNVDTSSIDIPVQGGSIRGRIYTPRTGGQVFPLIVYYHGGGWVIADLDTYDASAKALAEQSGSVVLSVHYRQGPEHKFPTAHNDAFAAYQWAMNNAGRLKADPARIAVAGESAGGNLAANVSIMARDKGIALPNHQLLVYPVANSDMNTESYQKYANAKPLNKAMMKWFANQYLPSMNTAKDTRISLVNANLKGLPPTTVITAEIDPLRDDGKLLVEKLKAADVAVDYKNYEGVTHEFFGMAAVVPKAKDAQQYASGRLKDALAEK